MLLTLLAAAVPAADPAPKRISVRLKFMAWEDGLLGCGVRIEGKVVPVAILADHLSEEIAYEGPARLEIVRLAADEPAVEATAPQGKAGKPAKPSPKPAPATSAKAAPPLAWIDFPPSAQNQHQILAVAPGKWEGGIMAIADSPDSFPPGSLRFFNLCPYRLEVRIGQNKVQIPPKEARSIRGGAKDHDYFDGSVMTYEANEERLGYSLHMFQDNTTRSLFFVGPGPEGSGTVTLRGVGDMTREKLPAPQRVGPVLLK